MNKIGNRGITLVALVITIIILLILAGITISQLSGSGLFENAKLAEQKSKEAQEKEEQQLSDYENKIGEYISSDRDTTEPNSENTMSGTEHFTGEYYLNGKPIYAKTVKIPFPNSTGNFLANHNIQNIEKIWYDLDNCFIEMQAIGDTTRTIPLPYHYTSDFSVGLGYINKDEMRIYTDYNRYSDGWVAVITVNYTKTTDNATKEINVETLTVK